MTDEHHAEQPEQFFLRVWLEALAAASKDAIAFKPKQDYAAALTIQRAFAAREADLVGAIKWAGEVSPPVNEFGCVTVDMALEQLNAMRTLAGFRALKTTKDA